MHERQASTKASTMGMGWHISVYRQISARDTPSADRDPRGALLATWQAGVGGLAWLTDLIEADDAVQLSANAGYPVRCTVRARAAIPLVTALEECQPDEWLLVEAWDES